MIQSEDGTMDPAMPAARPLQPEDYEALAAFRHGLRRLLAFSEAAARAHGLTPQQHQALLAIKGHKRGEPLTIGELAAHLLIRHHSAVELVDRLVAAGLAERLPAETDRRTVRVGLTPRAEAVLAALSASHLEEYRRSRGVLVQLLARLDAP
jgi:DNA-binding MarR family transcriptional regulator